MKDGIMELCPEIAEWQAELISEAAKERVEAEREACAKVCEETESSPALSDLEKYRTRFIADAIRARGQE